MLIKAAGLSVSPIRLPLFEHIPPHPADGPDVYNGLVPDYRGEDVNADTFLAVLAGDTAAVRGKGNGKVIASGARDRVFVFFSDHGAPGVLGMPAGRA